MAKKLLLLLLSLSNFSVFADTKTEIDHLLNFVEHTDCLYQRNGVEYKGTEARAHIQKKYDYYRDEIKTAEDFIVYSATQSIFTGEKYSIICANTKKQDSADWLNNELSHYRLQLTEK